MRLERLITLDQTNAVRLYVPSRCRLGRWSDSRVHYFYEVLFKRHSVVIRYCDEELIDFENDEGGAIKSHIGNISVSKEHKRIVDRGRKGKRNAVIDGSFPGRSSSYATEIWVYDPVTDTWVERHEPNRGGRPEGKVLRLQWLPAERATVKLIYDLLEEGLSLGAVAKELDRRGVRPPCGDPETRWHRNTVRSIARNTIYHGDLTWGRTSSDEEPVHYKRARAEPSYPILYPDFAPGAPIKRDQAERVRRLLAGNRVAWERRRAISRRYLLSGLLVCGKCGTTLHGHAQPRANGRDYLMYRHPSKPAASRVAHALFGSEPPADCEHRDRYVPVGRWDKAATAAVREVLHHADFVSAVRRAVEDRTGGEHAEEVAREIAALRERQRQTTQEMNDAAEAASRAPNALAKGAYQAVVNSRSEEIEALVRRLETLCSERDQLALIVGQLRQPTTKEIAETYDRLGFNELAAVLSAGIHHIEAEPDARTIRVVCRTDLRDLTRLNQ